MPADTRTDQPLPPSLPRDQLQREAQAQLALNELFPHLRSASDAALRDIVISLRVPSATAARPAGA